MLIAVPAGRRLNPVAHLEAWLARAGISEGPVFRSLVNGRLGSALTGQSVSLIVKRRAEAAGYAAADFAAHSLRAGFLTSAAAAGASVVYGSALELWKIFEQYELISTTVSQE